MSESEPASCDANPGHGDASPGDAMVSEHPAGVRRAYHLTVGYDGTDFVGWQKQEPPGQAPLRTVQGVLEEILRSFFHNPDLNLTGASRTDSGVHAIGQSCVFETATPVPVERMPLALTARCPEDIRVTAARLAPPNFNVIGGVRSKQYRYRLACGADRPLFNRRYVHHVYGPLDAERMQDAARRLVGEVNLAGFAAVGHGRISTVRTIHDCHVETPEGFPGEVHVVVSSNGFLLNTVRIIAGTLLEVGRGHFDPEQVTQALESGNRREAGPTLPPTGLCLEWVRYGE